MRWLLVIGQRGEGLLLSLWSEGFCNVVVLGDRGWNYDLSEVCSRHERGLK